MYRLQRHLRWGGVIVVISIVMAWNLGSAHAESTPVPTPRPTEAQPQPVSKPSEEPESRRVYRAYCPVLDMAGIAAEMATPIGEGECGERSPIHLSMVHGIKIESKPVMNCRMALVFSDWLQSVSALSDQILQAPISAVFTGPGYECRRRNRQPDGKISEHGFANAVDVSGFRLGGNRTLTVRDDFRVEVATDPDVAEDANSEAGSPTKEQAFLSAIHREACARFSTVLGPNSSPNHRDHFHLDMGCHGRDCRYKICE